ncbi:MAG: hypothetical protein GXC72_01200 [Chitinophagaceae bacterium]|nr:hypothetical protein [Chitinophagaceae bacterium]
MRLRLLSIALLGIFTFTGCTKDPVPTPAVPGIESMKVKEIRNGVNDYQQFFYNSNGQLIKYQVEFSSGTGQPSTYYVNLEYTNGQVSKATMPSGFSNYIYTDGKLSSIESFTNTGAKISSAALIINNKQQLVEMKETFGNPIPGGVVETKVIYVYNEQGNLIRKDYYTRETGSQFVYTESSIFENYDNKKIPQAFARAEFFLPNCVLMVNNPGRIISKSANGTINRIDRFEYQYNTEGYPTQRIWYVESVPNPVTPITFQYTYW